MRRILRKVACMETDNLGDISTLADPSAFPAFFCQSGIGRQCRILYIPRFPEQIEEKAL